MLAHLDILGVKELADVLGGAGGRFGPDDHRGAVTKAGFGPLELLRPIGDADPELGAQGHQLPAFEGLDGEMLLRVSDGTRRGERWNMRANMMGVLWLEGLRNRDRNRKSNRLRPPASPRSWD